MLVRSQQEIGAAKTAGDHINEIERVALGGTTPRDSAVVKSWLRCINDYGLDPTRDQEAYIVPHQQLKEHQEQAWEIIRIGKFGLENLFHHVASQHYVLLLSDAKGVTVEFLGDPTFNNHLRKAGLYLGSEWSEYRAGTCAVGSCIVSREPVVIHQDDHFDTSHIGLTCTAAPIFDTLGDITAVLDISQLRSPTEKVSQSLALHLVTATARRIELANLIARSRHDWILRLSRSPDFIDVEPDAAISIDSHGKISGMTHGGLATLAQSVHIRDLDTTRMIGEPISRYFDIDLNSLPRFMRDQPAGQRFLRLANGTVLFASSSAPTTSYRTPSTVESTIAASESLRKLSYGDPAMEALQTKAARLARRDIPILIQGETGAGKEYLARAIHDSSDAQGSFIAVNCAAIPEQLIESELFGYSAGAFTGALAKGKQGLIEAANGGTLFLDEIGDMPLSLQSRLLRVLSEQEITPIGSQKAKPVSFRLLSASHRQLDALVAEGKFREDLYYRLNAATLYLPPLRDRTDFDRLLDSILDRLSNESQESRRLAPETRAALKRHTWPGNIRELTNALRLALIISEGKAITLDCLPDNIKNAKSTSTKYNAVFASPSEPLEVDSDSSLKRALDDCNGNITELARRLGVNRSTVHRRINREGIIMQRRRI
jgi:transcriptional regulator of acetoin/glycerol metabolism